jgi:hypothetical protein
VNAKPSPVLRPLVLVSNVLFLAAVVLLVVWPVTGNGGFGVVGIGLFVFAIVAAGLNSVQRRARRRKGTP